MRSNLGLATILATLVSLNPTALSAQDLTIASFSAGSAECEDYSPDVAASHGGSFLLVWNRWCGSPPHQLVARLYDAEARPIGPEIDLGTGYSSSLIALPDGGYALAWVLSHADQELYLVRLDARGRRLGAPFVVDDGAPDPSSKSNARLAVDRAGRLALLWRRSLAVPPYRYDFLLRRFNADLTPSSEVTSLAGGTLHTPEDPDLAFADSGDLLVAWSQYIADAPNPHIAIFGRRYPVDGSPAGPSFRITQQLGSERHFQPRLIGAPRGGWLMAWQRRDFLGRGDSRFAHLAESTVHLGQVEGTVVDPSGPGYAGVSLAADSAGSVLVLTEEEYLGAVRGHLFNPAGFPIGSPIEVAPPPIWDLDGPTFSRSATGSFLAVWAEAGKVVLDFDFFIATEWDLRGRIFQRSCPVGQRAACLLSEQFGIEVLRPGAGGAIERARPILLDDGSALFAFPGRTPEVAVSLTQDGSRAGLTYAATTNSAITIRVTDRTTGRIETVTKPAGRFASGRIEGLAATPAARPAHTSVPTVGSAPPLGLFGDRFKVEVTWTGADGAVQTARGALFDDRRAAFRFGDDLSLTVALIDGRATNGKFWVVLGGLSDAGYRVKITDASTGKIKTYAKAAGRPQSRVDRQAF